MFDIRNGLKCECDEDGDTYVSFEQVYKDFANKEKQLREEKGSEFSESDLLDILYEVKVCPKCGKIREEIIRFDDSISGQECIYIGQTKIDKKDFDVLRKVYCY